MRKLAAIAILSIFTFNMVGYQLWYSYLATKADVALELALDAEQYNDADLLSIKQPTNLPYYSNNKTFERVDGEIEIDGIHYKYVKRRIYNDSLEMLCIPNRTKMQLEQSKHNYAIGAHDFQQDDAKKKSGEPTKSAQKQISEFEELLSMHNNAQVNITTSFVVLNSPVANQHYFTTAEQPPDAPLFA